MARLRAGVPHLAVLLLVLRVAKSAPADNGSNPDYYDDDVFVPSTDKENFDIFDWRLCKHLSEQEPGNVVVSPVSIKLVLAMLYEGAKDNTARELEETLNLPPKRLESRKKFTAVLNSLLAKKSEYLLDVGTKMYVRTDVNIRPRFSKILQSFYNASIQKIDFDQASQAVETVNSWVRDATNGRIKSMFSEDTVSPSTVMLLVNAIYFKGLWRYPFNETDTKPGLFQVTPSQSVTVPFMSMERDLYFSESVELSSSILRLPYMGNKYSMFIVLPHKPDGLEKLLNTVSPALLRNQLFLMDNVLVNVKLPKFNFDFTAELEDALKTLGIRDIFDEATADLPGVVHGNNIYVSKVIQKAGLEVNEKGTTAFASTGMVLNNKFGGDTYFHATHPFMFFIQDEKAGTIIFVGKLVNPSIEPVPLGNPHRPSVTELPEGALQSRLGAGGNAPERTPFPAPLPQRGLLFARSGNNNNVIDHTVSADNPDIPPKVWTYRYSSLLRQQTHTK